jgi:hypothetical protein
MMPPMMLYAGIWMPFAVGKAHDAVIAAPLYIYPAIRHRGAPSRDLEREPGCKCPGRDQPLW